MPVTLSPSEYWKLRVLQYLVSKAAAEAQTAEADYNACISAIHAAHADFDPSINYSGNDDTFTLTEPV